MATAKKIIERAFSISGIKTAETPLEASEIQDGLDTLNDMGSAWESRLQIGFMPVETVGNTVRIPRDAEFAFKQNLAVQLRVEYKLAPDPVLVITADKAFKDLNSTYLTIGAPQYPDSLPVGSGNECPELFDDRFFPDNVTENF